MTTTVTITHEGPHHHDVLVQVVQDYKENGGSVRKVSDGTRLKPGNSVKVTLFDTQTIYLAEVEPVPAAP